MKGLRILLADDHELVRRGLRALLEERPGWTVVGEATGGREAVAMAAELRPRVVIMDVTMPGLNGLEATRQILAAQPDTQILILSVHESDELLRQVLAAGARGYVLKSDAGSDLVAAVEALSVGRPFLTARLADRVFDDYASRERALEEASAAKLSPREREVMQMLAEGKSNKEIADTLDISVKTVETHRSRVMSKLDLHSMSDLVRYAVRNRIIEV